MPLTALTLSFECDQTSRNGMNVVGADSAPVIYQANVTTVRASLFNGTPTTSTFVSDISNVISARLLIRKNYENGTVLIDKTATLDGTTTYAQWVAGTKQQFLFSLTASETNQTVTSDGTLDIYGVIEIITDTGPIVIGFFNGNILFDGITGVDNPPAPTSGVKEWHALMEAHLSAAPTATVLKNTLGNTIVWTRNSVGLYTGTLADAFTNRTKCIWSGGENISAGVPTIYLRRTSNDTVVIAATDAQNGFDEPLFSASAPLNVEITVYP